MKKKATNEDVEVLLKQWTEEINSELDYELRVAESRMLIAERELTDSYSEEQKKLYENFLTERQAFCDLLTEKYKSLK